MKLFQVAEGRQEGMEEEEEEEDGLVWVISRQRTDE